MVFKLFLIYFCICMNNVYTHEQVGLEADDRTLLFNTPHYTVRGYTECGIYHDFPIPITDATAPTWGDLRHSMYRYFTTFFKNPDTDLFFHEYWQKTYNGHILNDTYNSDSIHIHLGQYEDPLDYEQIIDNQYINAQDIIHPIIYYTWKP